MNEISDAKNVKAKITCIAGQTTLDNQREIKKDEEIIFLLQVHMHYYSHSAYFKIFKKMYLLHSLFPSTNSLLLFRSSPIGSPFITVVSIAENPKNTSDNNGHNNKRRKRLLRNGVEDDSSIQGISKVFVQFEIVTL